MQGLHLTADLHGCPADAAAMTDTGALRAVCLAAVGAAGLEPVGELFHRFATAAGAAPEAQGAAQVSVQVSVQVAVQGAAGATPAAPVGITGVVLLAESHLAVHTWPEMAAVTLDVYVCNFGADNSARAHALMDRLIASFEPAQVQRHALQRGGAVASVVSARSAGSASAAGAAA